MKKRVTNYVYLLNFTSPSYTWGLWDALLVVIIVQAVDAHISVQATVATALPLGLTSETLSGCAINQVKVVWTLYTVQKLL